VSQENVNTVRRGIEAFNERDIEALAALVTPDFGWFPALVRGLDGGGYRGREGIARYFGDLRATWEHLRVLADEYRDLGEGVLVLGRTDAQGIRSGVSVDAPIGIGFDFRSGRVSRTRAFLDHVEALNAAGLER
jgi:ketosteroid isomerase-like protein